MIGLSKFRFSSPKIIPGSSPSQTVISPVSDRGETDDLRGAEDAIGDEAIANEATDAAKAVEEEPPDAPDEEPPPPPAAPEEAPPDLPEGEENGVTAVLPERELEAASPDIPEEEAPPDFPSKTEEGATLGTAVAVAEVARLAVGVDPWKVVLLGVITDEGGGGIAPLSLVKT